MIKNIVFIDTEVDIHTKIINDFGAASPLKGDLHTKSFRKFEGFISNCEYLCGHNIINHDIVYIEKYIGNIGSYKQIDTLYLSPLLFPKKPYHRLLKDDKLQSDQLNNPLNDSKKAGDLFFDEINAFNKLSDRVKFIYYELLSNVKEFKDFFDYLDYKPEYGNLLASIKDEYSGKICENANLTALINQYKVELAYTLAIIGTDDYNSITPPWLLKNYPKIENVIKLLCGSLCESGCPYCKQKLDKFVGLKNNFGYNEFRTFNGEKLQENAVQAALEGKSLVAVFPTGGGKSITFQLPALILGKQTKGLTVVISPLQSLMKDQIDNLVEKGIDTAVTINGLLSPIERSKSIEMVANGEANILYISPEMLRSRTIEKLLKSRNIIRFIIDEAHCFSAWGQDFRVDYLYIAKFIKKLQEYKQTNKQPIPVSCFTATAKQKVISDIRDYFYNNLGLNLELFTTDATRENLHYTVLFRETKNEKYNTLRNLLDSKHCPTIIYVSRVKTSEEIATKLTLDGYKALPYNGKMDVDEKVSNQDKFMNEEVNIIVATSAFGMGVDKSNVGLVIHYEISDSLENYVQEAGRAGRDPSLKADCYVLYNNQDLDKHFVLLNQTKLSISEIQQVWKAIKDLTKEKSYICCSALEIAKQAGWDSEVNNSEIETRVKTAIAALESANYVTRGNNVPKVFATSISAKNMNEASILIRNSNILDEQEKNNSLRIIKSLISSRSIANAGNDDAESRVDYLADNLALSKEAVINAVNKMKQEGILDDYNDMSAFIYDGDTEHKSQITLDRFIKLERFIISKLDDEVVKLNFKELNEEALDNDIPKSTVKNIRIILHYLSICNFITKTDNNDLNYVSIAPKYRIKEIKKKFEDRIDICKFILSSLYEKALADLANNGSNDKKIVEFSLVGLYKEYQARPRMDYGSPNTSLNDIENALLYLNLIGSMKLEGGFLVLYNGMEIHRKVFENRIQYKIEDYKLLNDFYKQKIQQIHIVGEYANLMVKDYNAALRYVKDYFNMDFKEFIKKYFDSKRTKEIERNITPNRYKKLFGNLSEKQREIIDDSKSQHIVVAAGPGSGKTRVLVHKLASLLLMEDVKHEQLLMLTFTRSAANEFKSRLIDLIGDAAFYVEIKTFHSYAFDLIGQIGNIDKAESVVRDAAEMIHNGEVEEGKITKSVLVIDEAQDMSKDEFELVRALMNVNEEMRVIAVGDDDQNIYEFRGSNSEYLKTLITDYNAKQYEMLTNYRSTPNIINFSNAFLKRIQNRLKHNSIVPNRNDNGLLKIVKHTSYNMVEALVNDLIKLNLSGRTCILTNTNEESLLVFAALLEHNKSTKLIQSLGDFRLKNLLELRAFENCLNEEDSPIISDEIWNKSVEYINKEYSNSTCLEVVNNIFKSFENTNNRKYRTDFDELLYESNYEDFQNDNENDVIYVSTIHKAKGREFDNVILLLKDETADNDEKNRKIYVGITRAKTNLIIHTNTKIFGNYKYMNLDYSYDKMYYNDPKEIIFQLTHRDVFLGSFKGKENIITKLRSGDKLIVKDNCFYTSLYGEEIKIGTFSKAFKEKLENLTVKGYKTETAEIRFIVYWKGEDEEKEIPILLPTLYLKK